MLNASKASESSSSLGGSVLFESCSDSMWLSVSVPEYALDICSKFKFDRFVLLRKAL